MIESLYPYIYVGDTYGEDVLRLCGHYHMEVDAIVGYEDEDNDQVIQVNTLVYARNGYATRCGKAKK